MTVYGLPLTYLAVLAGWIGMGLFLLWRLLLWRRRFKTQPGRLRWVNLGLSTWMVLTTLTLMEIYFAVLYDQSDSFNMTKVSKAWYARHVVKNKDDFRDTQPLLKTPPPGKKTLWFFGDSFTFGHGINRVEDRFSDRVARELERQRPGEFLVNNLADPGTNISQTHGLMKVFWSKGYQPPDLAVFVICLNDVEPYIPDNNLKYKKMGEWGPPTFLFQESYLLNFLWFRIQQSRQPAVRDYFGDLVDAYSGHPGNRLLTELDQMRFTCESQKVDFRVVIFPFLHNLGPNYPFGPAHEKLVAHCRRQKIPVLDLRSALEPHAAEGLVVNRFDAHPSVRAHMLAAEAIQTELLKDVFTGK